MIGCTIASKMVGVLLEIAKARSKTAARVAVCNTLYMSANASFMMYHVSLLYVLLPQLCW